MSWVAGGGKFGLRAARLLLSRGMPCRIVEKDPRRCVQLAEEGFGVECDDAVDFLAALLSSGASPSWVIAAVPLHFAFEWSRKCLFPEVDLRRSSPPEALLQLLPHLSRGPSGDLYASYADFLCPEDCLEDATCAVTGERRPESLYRRIARLDLPGVNILVVRSYQLAAGVGGIRSVDLKRAIDAIRDHKRPFLLATSCRCHAVLTYFVKSIC